MSEDLSKLTDNVDPGALRTLLSTPLPERGDRDGCSAYLSVVQGALPERVTLTVPAHNPPTAPLTLSLRRRSPVDGECSYWLTSPVSDPTQGVRVTKATLTHLGPHLWAATPQGWPDTALQAAARAGYRTGLPRLQALLSIQNMAAMLAASCAGHRPLTEQDTADLLAWLRVDLVLLVPLAPHLSPAQRHLADELADGWGHGPAELVQAVTALTLTATHGPE